MKNDLAQMELRYRYYMRQGKYHHAETMKLLIRDYKARYGVTNTNTQFVFNK